MNQITVTLDRPRPIRWTNKSDHRIGSLDRPPALADLAHKNARKGFYALCAFVWASLEGRDHGFADPEELAEYLGKPEAQAAAWDALKAALQEAGVISTEKKSASPETSGCENGRSPSSNLAQPAQPTTI